VMRGGCSGAGLVLQLETSPIAGVALKKLLQHGIAQTTERHMKVTIQTTTIRAIVSLCLLTFASYTRGASSGPCVDIVQDPGGSTTCACIANVGCPGSAQTWNPYYKCVTAPSGYTTCTSQSQVIGTIYTCTSSTSVMQQFLCYSQHNYDPCCFTTCTKATSGTPLYALVATYAEGICP